jgi:dynactin-2
MGAIAALNRRTALLDGGHLDHVEGRLAALLQKMTSIAERKQTQEDAEKMAKLNTLYDLVQKSEAMGAALPELVDRLDALQGLHEKGEKDDS